MFLSLFLFGDIPENLQQAVSFTNTENSPHFLWGGEGGRFGGEEEKKKNPEKKWNKF